MLRGPQFLNKLFFIIGFLIFSLVELVYAQLSNYFPLHEGNYWVQHTDSIRGEFKPCTMRREIEGTNLIQGLTYFRLKENMTADDGSLKWTWYSWLRSENNNILLAAFGEDSIITQIQIPSQTVIVDGNITDWAGINPLSTDSQGDDTLNYAGADIQAVFVAKDTDHLFLRMDLWENVNINFRNGTPPDDGRYVFRVGNNGTYQDMELGIAYDPNNSQWSLGFNGSNSGVPPGLEGPSYVGVRGNHIELQVPLTMIGNPSYYTEIKGKVVNYYYQYGAELDEAGVQATTIFDPPLQNMVAQAPQIGLTWQFNAPEMGGLFLNSVEDVGVTVQSPAGTFNDCIKIKLMIINQLGDTTQINYSYYANGIGEVLNQGWQMNMGNFRFLLTDYSVVPVNPIQVVQESPPESGKDMTLSVSPPQNFQPTTRILYYRFPGQKTWPVNNQITLTPSGNQYEAIIPSSLVTYRGIEYYIELDNGFQKIYYPEINPQNSPVSVRVSIDRYQPSLFLQSMIYKMVSVPVELNDKSISAVLGDDYGVYDIKSWRLFRWQQADSAYVEYPAINSSFTPGTAFWLVTRWGENFDVENGLSMEAFQPFELILQPGWNQVANPFPFPILSDSCIADSGVEPPVSYDGQQYHYDVAVIESWEGYFVYNNNNGIARVIIPPISAELGVPKYKKRTDIEHESEFFVQLAAEMPGTILMDTENYIGVLQNAQDGKDHFDISEPPPIGDFVQLSIMENHQCFAGNFKPFSENGHCWDVNVNSTIIQKEIQIILNQTGKLPNNFQYYILDKDNHCRIPVQNNTFHLFVTKDIPTRHLKIIIGTEKYAEEHRGDIPIEPIAFYLGQNYPNPFNAETTIQYQLGKRSHVVIEIYNLMGQKIRTLLNQVQRTGHYQLTWNSRDDFNRPVSSGIYFCYMKTGDFSSSKKLLFIK